LATNSTITNIDFIFIEYIYRGGRLELNWPEPSFNRIGSVEMTLLISTIKADMYHNL